MRRLLGSWAIMPRRKPTAISPRHASRLGSFRLTGVKSIPALVLLLSFSRKETCEGTPHTEKLYTISFLEQVSPRRARYVSRRYIHNHPHTTNNHLSYRRNLRDYVLHLVKGTYASVSPALRTHSIPAALRDA